MSVSLLLEHTLYPAIIMSEMFVTASQIYSDQADLFF